MSIDANVLGQILILLLALNVLVAVATWILARHRTDAPGVVTACNVALGLFAPLNLLALTLLAMLPVRPGR